MRLFSIATIGLIMASAASFGIFPQAAKPDRFHPTGDEYIADDDAPFIPAVVKFSDEEELREYLDRGATLLRRRDDMALLYLPRESARRAAARDRSGQRFHIGRRATPTMDKALDFFGARRVIEGTGLPHPFTGKGVVVGLCDIGFDPSHPNFLDAEGKETRIRRITQYKEAQGQRIVLDFPEQFKEWATDSVDHYHATHVAGILAGADRSAGYGGVASGAEIVATTSQLSDVGLLAGVEDIIEYARESGRPAVVNLSMGNYVGPHDGTSLFSQYMDKLGEEAIIVMSAGNEGRRENTLPFTFTDGKQTIGVRLHNYKWTQYDMEGMTDIWSADSRSIGLRVAVYDEMTGETPLVLPRFELNDGETTVITAGEGEWKELGKYYTGRMEITGGVNSENGRYNVALVYELHTDISSDEGPWARYNIALITDGESGQHIDIYTDGSTTRLRAMPGEPAPGSTASISDLATGKNVVCVGMYNSRADVPLLDGGTMDGKVEAGTVNINSSYATLLDGRVYPHTTAPGNPVVSSMSSPFLAAHPEELRYCSAESKRADGSSYYWVHEGGTSMSSPYVAGFIATWLEADPTLTVADVMEIIAATNRHDIPDPENPRHGQGWFDPYAGLLKVLERSGVSGVEREESRTRVTLDGKTVHIFNPDSTRVDTRVYDVTGRMLAKTVVTDTYGEILLEGAGENGIVLINVRGSDGFSHTIKASLER